MPLRYLFLCLVLLAGCDHQAEDEHAAKIEAEVIAEHKRQIQRCEDLGGLAETNWSWNDNPHYRTFQKCTLPCNQLIRPEKP